MLTEKAKEIVAGADKKMQDAVAFLEEDLKTYRVGKANPSIFNNVMVNYYGSMAPISNVANVSCPDARTIAITPWEKSMFKEIEKKIQAFEKKITQDFEEMTNIRKILISLGL